MSEWVLQEDGTYKDEDGWIRVFRHDTWNGKKGKTKTVLHAQIAIPGATGQNDSKWGTADIRTWQGVPPDNELEDVKSKFVRAAGIEPPGHWFRFIDGKEVTEPREPNDRH